MATTIIRRSSFYISTLPIFIVAAITRLLRYNSLIIDYEKCAKLINSIDLDIEIINQNLIQTLVAAEDHRNDMHYGIDQLSVIRVIILRFLTGKVQGASTIEQQFVRTVSGRYERTIRRKLREQVLSVMIGRDFSKKEICTSYMSCAFFGSGLIGAEGIRSIKQKPEYLGDESVIACLKYPMPLNPTKEYLEIYFQRVIHIQRLKASYDKTP
ncbi:transglycosylase domain-containing protein [Stutzerimonas stutzeri]|uniref:transglycosylase domain-containing protein n=1 Tax=Stutzerimonas stutzeri TaxID=316 RepID=UPI001303BD5A|nr:transglycosylase domain-containing protein [Stutzerimonas stutzeri]